jgi:hypothetical protein
MDSESFQYSTEQQPVVESDPAPRFIKRYRLAAGIAALAMLLGAIATIAGMAHSAYIAYSPLPWVDQWVFLQELVANHGHYGLALLWKQHGEHRIPLPKLFYLADLYLFGGRNVFLLVSIFVLQMVHAAWLGVVHKKIGGLSGGVLWTSVALTTIALFWFTQTENFWFASDLPVVFPWLGATIAFSSLAFSKLRLESSRTGAKGFLLLAWGGALIASLSLTNGLLLWPMLVLTMIIWKMPSKMWAATALAAAVFIGFWATGYTKPVHGNSLSHLSLSLGLKLIQYVLLLYGTSWTYINKQMAVILPVVAVPGAIFAYVWFVFLKRGRDVFATVLLSVMAFVVASTFATAVGRIDWGVQQAAASRYQTGAMLFWSCLSVLIIWQLSRIRAHKAWIVLLIIQLGWIFALVRAVQLEPAVAHGARIHADSFNSAGIAVQLGVHDSPTIMYVTIPPYRADDILLLANYLRLHRWSVFALPARAPLGRDFKRFYRVVDSRACIGSVESAEAISYYRWSGFRLRGWAYDLRDAKPARDVLFVDANDRIAGRARPGFWRPELDAKLAYLNDGVYSAYLGYIPADLESSTIRAFAVLSDGASACPINSGRPVQLDLQTATYTGLQPTGLTQYLTRDPEAATTDFDAIGSAAIPPGAVSVTIDPDKKDVIDGCAVDPEKHPGRAADLVVDDVPLRMPSYGQLRAGAARGLRLPTSTACGFEGLLPPLTPGQHKIAIRVVPRDQDIYYESAPLTVIVH